MKKKLSVGSWVLCVFFILAGITYLFFPGILFLIAAVLVCPAFRSRVELPKKSWVSAVVILFFVGLICTPSEEIPESNISEITNSSSQNSVMRAAINNSEEFSTSESISSSLSSSSLSSRQPEKQPNSSTQSNGQAVKSSIPSSQPYSQSVKASTPSSQSSSQPAKASTPSSQSSSQPAKASTSSSQFSSQPAKVLSSSSQSSSSSSNLSGVPTDKGDALKINNDLRSIEAAVVAAVPQKYQSKWFDVSCDEYSDNSISAFIQIDQGTDDTDSALSLAAECFIITKEAAEVSGVELDSVAITVVNDGDALGIYATENGEDFTLIADGKKTEVSLKSENSPAATSSSQISQSTVQNKNSSSNGNPFNEVRNDFTPQTTYVLNTNTMKIHYSNCSSVKTIKPENYAETTKTVSELKAQGYTPCGKCKPQ